MRDGARELARGVRLQSLGLALDSFQPRNRLDSANGPSCGVLLGRSILGGGIFSRGLAFGSGVLPRKLLLELLLLLEGTLLLLGLGLLAGGLLLLVKDVRKRLDGAKGDGQAAGEVLEALGVVGLCVGEVGAGGGGALLGPVGSLCTLGALVIV